MWRKRSGRAPAVWGMMVAKRASSVDGRAMTVLTSKKSGPKTERGAELARQRFLQTLATTINVTAACRAANISRQTAYTWREADPEFAQAWSDAMDAALDDLEEVTAQRARDGSDLLMMFLLKANRPDKYRETVTHEARGEVKVNVVFTNNWRGAAGSGAAPAAMRPMVDADGTTR